jgi:hypothetical protein
MIPALFTLRIKHLFQGHFSCSEQCTTRAMQQSMAYTRNPAIYLVEHVSGRAVQKDNETTVNCIRQKQATCTGMQGSC